MKYGLDIVLIIGMLWIGWLWNGEKQNALQLGDEIDKYKANIARLELDLNAAQETGAKAAADLEVVREELGQATEDAQARADELADTTQKLATLKETGARLKARVEELEGYKAKAIVAEMPKPPAQ